MTLSGDDGFDLSGADPWDSWDSEEVPEWDPAPASGPESVDFKGSEDQSGAWVDAAGPSRVGPPRPLKLIRSHPFAAVLGVCFVVAALLMLSIRPSGQVPSGRRVSANHPSRAGAKPQGAHPADRTGGKREASRPRGSGGKK
jgi:hypothetical protein